jgi:hypothetical protein
LASKPATRDEIIRRARKYKLDPAAVLAVAMGEGGLQNRQGDVGDLAGGGSYGPFQLYAQGALPKRFRGKPQQADAWAWSPAGIDYALRKMKEAGAAGLKGEAAVNAIVRRFERPADTDGSVQRAVARLSSIGPVQAPLRATGKQPGVRQLAAAAPSPGPAQLTLNALFKKAGLPPIAGLGDTMIGPNPAVTSSQQIAPGPKLQPIPAAVKKGKVPKLPRVQRMVSLIDYASQLGLSVRENPYVDGVDPVHTEGSHHYQTIGKHKGKPVGRAIDVSGDPAKLRAFFAYAEQFAGKGLNDLFYDPMKYSYDRGKRWNKTIGGHGSHVHLSVL